MKVKVFKEFGEDHLEKQINKWLAENPVIVQDLKFSTITYEKMNRKLLCFSVVILYTEERSNDNDTRYR